MARLPRAPRSAAEASSRPCCPSSRCSGRASAKRLIRLRLPSIKTLAGTLADESARQMREAIEEGCERVDEVSSEGTR